MLLEIECGPCIVVSTVTAFRCILSAVQLIFHKTPTKLSAKKRKRVNATVLNYLVHIYRREISQCISFASLQCVYPGRGELLRLCSICLLDFNGFFPCVFLCAFSGSTLAAPSVSALQNKTNDRITDVQVMPNLK